MKMQPSIFSLFNTQQMNLSLLHTGQRTHHVRDELKFQAQCARL